MDVDGSAKQSCGVVLGEGSVKMVVVTDGSMQGSGCGTKGYGDLNILFFENKKAIELQYCVTFCCKASDFTV